MPVARDHLGDFLGAHLGAQQLACFGSPSPAFSAALSWASSCGSLPYCSSATFSSLPALQPGDVGLQAVDLP
jgi:hypothetical protein